VCTHTSPSGCHSYSCGQPASACSSGKQLGDDAEIHGECEANRRRVGEQQFFDFAPDPFGRQIVERDAATDVACRLVERETEPRDELDRAQHAQAVVGNVCASTIRSRRRSMSPRPSNGSKYSSDSGSHEMALT
jgi:hypothetical protein